MVLGKITPKPKGTNEVSQIKLEVMGKTDDADERKGVGIGGNSADHNLPMIA